MKPTFEFAPRMEVLLRNLDVVREVQLAFNEFVPQEVDSFLSYVSRRLDDEEVWREWDKSIRKHVLQIRPPARENDDSSIGQWCVKINGRIHQVAIVVDCEPLFQPDLYQPGETMWIGLQLPSKWNRSQEFNRKIAAHVPKGFDHIGERDDVDIAYPLWSNIDIKDYFGAEKTDVGQLADKILSLVGKVGEAKAGVDAVLAELQSEPQGESIRP